MWIDLDSALERLSYRDRSILIMWLNGWTHKEISERIGLERSTVTKIIGRSVHILSKFFTVEYE
jgi:DNA-directed RNA polymerase specialized sigma24 family protein